MKNQLNSYFNVMDTKKINENFGLNNIFPTSHSETVAASLRSCVATRHIVTMSAHHDIVMLW